MSKLAVALAALVLVYPAFAEANGRFPQSVNAHTHPGNSENILLPVTFGVLSSTDGGTTFQWMCEDAVGYGGTYDPDYAFSPTGTRFATTFDGLKMTKDGGCHWTDVTGDLADAWVGEVEIGPNGKVWAATSSGGAPNDVYVSDDDGANFTASNLFHDSGWWKSLRVAPSNADRIYVTGYLVATTPEAMLRRSDNGGETWSSLPVTDFAFGSQPQLMVEAVSPTNPDIVFARVLGALAPAGDAIYRSDDAGASWTKVLEMADVITAFLVRADGTTVIAGTIGPCADDPADSNKGCVRISGDGGISWNRTTQEPKMACIAERADGVLLACGANWEPDDFALARSTDGQTWTKTFRFSEMTGPVACDPGTVQFDTCELEQWQFIADQFGVAGAGADAGTQPSIDAATNGGDDSGKPNGKGCGCSMGLAAVFFLPLGWRRRRSPG